MATRCCAASWSCRTSAHSSPAARASRPRGAEPAPVLVAHDTRRRVAMFFVVLPTDDTAYNAAVRANPAIGQEVEANWHATVVPWLRALPGFQGLVAGVDH